MQISVSFQKNDLYHLLLPNVNYYNVINSETVVSFFHKIKCFFQIPKYLQHAISDSLHFFDGTQRFDEPVSKITLKFWGGVPIDIGP